MPSYNKLSIILPSYNEEQTIGQILRKIISVKLINDLPKEIIIVDDGSTDNTREEVYNIIDQYPNEQIIYVKHPVNQGKGTAIRTGIPYVTGNYTIIQDGDLEYDPEDYNKLLPVLLTGEYSVVYGSRFLNNQNVHFYRIFYCGVRVISIVTNILYSQKLTDEPTCYKMFMTSVLKSVNLSCTGFEFCPEVTAKVSRLGYKIKEVPIGYFPRSFKDGKKIKWTDGVEAIWVLVKCRFTKI